MAFIIVNSPSDNIWEINKELEIITEFRQLKKDEGEFKSSQILKAIYYIWDPKSNINNSGFDEDKLIQDVTETLIGDPDFKWEDYEAIKQVYLENNLSKNEKLLLKYRKEIQGLSDLLDTWAWSKSDAKTKGEVVSQYKRLFEDLKEVETKFLMEKHEMEEMLGNYVKSRFERYGNQ